MKVKLIAVLIAVAAIFIGAVLWRTDSFVYGDRMSWVEAQTRTQLGSMNRSLATELKSLQRVVATFSSDNFQKGKLNWNSLSPYYAAASFSLNGNNLDPQVLLTKENSKAANWTKDFVKSAIGTLAGRTSDLRFYVKPFQDSQRGRYVALVFLEGNKAYAIFGSGETFQSLIDAQRGSLSSFSIVTSSGLTVGHSVPEYLGTVMRDDPVFKEALQSGSSHGSNTFNLKSGALYGMYEVVPQSNLLVLSSAPLSDTMKGRKGLWWQFFLLGCGLVTVGVAAILWVIMPAENKMEDLEEKLIEARAKPVALAVPEKVVALDPELAQKEKVDASMRVASALAHEMRGPLASILGYSQMILAKSSEGDIVDPTDSILRETRAARGILDKLLGYAGEEVKEKNSMKIEGPLVKALKNLEPLFTEKGVKITKNIQETMPLDLHVDAVIRAISNVLENSVEAMERMVNKEIKVDLFEDAEGVHLNIADSGEGIEAANIEKIFDPFFTTRSFHNHMGLGLSVSFGILKEHNADFHVESQRGQGTKIMMTFRKIQTAEVLKAPAAVIPAPPPAVVVTEKPQEEELVIATELPKLKEESTHREEAELQFAEVQQAVQTAEQKTDEVKPVIPSPLDVNIDKLLELPEAPETATVVTAAPAAQKPVITSAKVSKPPVKFGDDELTFIDGFLSEEKTAPAPVAKVEPEPVVVTAPAAPAEEVLAVLEEATVITPTAEVKENVPTKTELETMDQNLSPAGLVNPPKALGKQKTSKLDSYHVEIRRPGKRI